METLEKDAALLDPQNFDVRADALELIEFHMIEPLESRSQAKSGQEEWLGLKSRAETLKRRLEEIDDKLFEQLRAGVISGQCRGKAFEGLMSEYFDLTNIDCSQEGYDNLDLFINRLFPAREIPEPTRELSPEMVFYQKTPTRLVFEMLRKAGLTEKDVFFDIGSGLGQVAILVNLIAGIRVCGIELEPAFCDFARDCVASLNVTDATFINADAREADYSIGTAFFMYTPFKGEILQQVLSRLKQLAFQRQIRIITYGPCTAGVALTGWLRATEKFDANGPAVFTSILEG